MCVEQRAFSKGDFGKYTAHSLHMPIWHTTIQYDPSDDSKVSDSDGETHW